MVGVVHFIHFTCSRLIIIPFVLYVTAPIINQFESRHHLAAFFSFLDFEIKADYYLLEILRN
jgi:hypothetical protein